MFRPLLVLWDMGHTRIVKSIAALVPPSGRMPVIYTRVLFMHYLQWKWYSWNCFYSMIDSVSRQLLCPLSADKRHVCNKNRHGYKDSVSWMWIIVLYCPQYGWSFQGSKIGQIQLSVKLPFINNKAMQSDWFYHKCKCSKRKYVFLRLII